ncbi:MAG: lysine-2,3-aminomutase-like protein [Magnetospirillum sp. WYHS-4]
MTASFRQAPFPARIAPEYRALMGDAPNDPLARQVVPSPEELAPQPEDRIDPIGDTAHSPLEGLVHRHPDRVLLKPTLACPIHCRFCFRRDQVGRGGTLKPAALAAALDYIRVHPEIREVILTGGDPLMLSPARLERLTRDLSMIDHLKWLRVHSRVPVAMPSRIAAAAVRALKAGRLATWVAVHCNHPRELSPAALAALGRLADAGIPLVSQTVLLKGVNDDVAVLAELMESLLAARVKPYYLHHGDLVPGAAHFRVSLPEGIALAAELRRRVSGLALPTYVLDIPGGFGKVPVGPSYLEDGGAAVLDPQGRRHAYPVES